MQAVPMFDSLQLYRELDESAVLSQGRDLRISVLDAALKPVTLFFTGVGGLRSEDSRLFQHFTRLTAPRYDTLLRVLDSDWLQDLKCVYLRP